MVVEEEEVGVDILVVPGVVLPLPDSLTVDVDPDLSRGLAGSEAEGVPGVRSPRAENEILVRPPEVGVRNNILVPPVRYVRLRSSTTLEIY